MFRMSLLALALLVSAVGCGRSRAPALAVQAEEKKPEYVLATSIKELEKITKQEQVPDLGKKYPHVDWRGTKATFDEKTGYYLDDVFGQRVYWSGHGGELSVVQSVDLWQSGGPEQKPGDVLVEFGKDPQLLILVTVKPEVWRLSTLEDVLPESIARKLIPITDEETKKVKEGEQRRIGKSSFHVRREKGQWKFSDIIRYPADRDRTRKLFRNNKEPLEIVTVDRSGNPHPTAAIDLAVAAFLEQQVSPKRGVVFHIGSDGKEYSMPITADPQREIREAVEKQQRLSTPAVFNPAAPLVEEVPPALARAQARQNPPPTAGDAEPPAIAYLREQLAEADAALIRAHELLARSQETQHLQTLLLDRKDDEIRSLYFTLANLTGRLKGLQPKKN